jgi:trehalose 6-phosphate phosphatase
MTGKSLQKSRQQPNTMDQIQESLAPFVETTAATAIFLDLDGTLAPIMPRPDDVAIPNSISKLIRKLSHMYLAVTVVSGRPATEAMRITGNSELAYIGNHGFETMLPGHAVVVCDEAQPYVAKIRELVDFSRSLEEMIDSGIWLEDKTATMSFHFRRAPDPEAARALIEKHIFPRISKLGLEPREGRMVIEVRPPLPIDKGVAIGQLLDRLGVKQAVYIGDDTTDIDAFKELRKRRRRKFKTVCVGVISSEMPKELPKYSDLMVERVSGVEIALQILAAEEP